MGQWKPGLTMNLRSCQWTIMLLAKLKKLLQRNQYKWISLISTLEEGLCSMDVFRKKSCLFYSPSFWLGVCSVVVWLPIKPF